MMIATKTSQYKGFGGGSGTSSVAIAASALRLAAKDLGMKLSDQQMRILLGHATFESNFGMDGAKNSLRNTNNWGAIQSTQPFAKAHAGQSGYGAVAHQDSDPVHGKFVGWYAVNPTPVAGAKQFLNQVKGQLNGASSVYDYAARLYQSGYFGGMNAGASGDPRKAGKRSLPFLPAEQKNVDSYARNIQAAMPGSLPQDTSETVEIAQTQKVGPFAPVSDRITAAGRGRNSPPASEKDAENAWNGSRGNSGAYGVPSSFSFDELKQNNGFVSFDGSSNQQSVASNTGNSTIDQMLANIAKALDSAASKQSSFSIIVKADDFSTKLEYARILSSALKEELLMHTRTYTNENEVEVRCEDPTSFAMIKAVSNDVAHMFNQATNNIVSTVMTKTSKTEYQELDLKTAELHFRKFRLGIYGKNR